jgi:hypothetical protein
MRELLDSPLRQSPVSEFYRLNNARIDPKLFVNRVKNHELRIEF